MHPPQLGFLIFVIYCHNMQRRRGARRQQQCRKNWGHIIFRCTRRNESICFVFPFFILLYSCCFARLLIIFCIRIQMFYLRTTSPWYASGGVGEGKGMKGRPLNFCFAHGKVFLLPIRHCKYCHIFSGCSLLFARCSDRCLTVVSRRLLLLLQLYFVSVDCLFVCSSVCLSICLQLRSQTFNPFSVRLLPPRLWFENALFIYSYLLEQ